MGRACRRNHEPIGPADQRASDVANRSDYRVISPTARTPRNVQSGVRVTHQRAAAIAVTGTGRLAEKGLCILTPDKAGGALTHQSADFERQRR